jgi:hypothetical protein
MVRPDRIEDISAFALCLGGSPKSHQNAHHATGISETGISETGISETGISETGISETGSSLSRTLKYKSG